MRLSRICSLCVLMLLLLVCRSAVSVSYYYGIMEVDDCKEWVSLREKPSTKSRRLAKVPLHALVTDAAWTSEYGEFAFCRYNGQSGYILLEYLQKWQESNLDEMDGYSRTMGFTMWYDPARLRVTEDAAEKGSSMLIEASREGVPAYLEIMPAESVGMEPKAFLMQSAPKGTVIRNDESAYSMEISYYQKPSALNPDLMETCYAVTCENLQLVATGTWPASENEVWLATFGHVLRSIWPEQPFPVRADWAEEADQVLVVDEEGENVSIMADDPVTDVQLLSLDLSPDEYGDMAFQATVLQTCRDITEDEPLVIRIAFPGDVPAYGIRVTDVNYTIWQFAIGISGEDGSLVLSEF
ncbi:MAG: hypothetical protein IJ246_12410 [Clostridia bacterium]|nr:hypothetical protein [Clostridia bacterium]